jgi:hypothetical protein
MPSWEGTKRGIGGEQTYGVMMVGYSASPLSPATLLLALPARGEVQYTRCTWVLNYGEELFRRSFLCINSYETWFPDRLIINPLSIRTEH